MSIDTSKGIQVMCKGFDIIYKYSRIIEKKNQVGNKDKKL